MVIRINKTKNYTVMSNYHLHEKDMSLKAKGLLSLMLSLPDDWDYSIDGLIKLSKDGKDSVTAAIIELEKFGYLVRTQAKDKSGRFSGYDYDVYENPMTGEPLTENPPTENPTQLNTNNQNNKEQNTKRIKEEEARTINDIIAEQKEELQEPLQEYVKMRKAIKKPITTHGLELALKRLNELTDDTSVAVKIINQSIMNSWQGLFELKSENKTNATAFKSRNYSKEELDSNIDNIDDIDF